jgi:hypothetical protein
MSRTIFIAFLLTSILIFTTALIGGTDHTYVGAKTCKMCHSGEAKGKIYDKWAESAHAKTTELLKDKEVTDKCYGCHATGFGKGGYSPQDTTGLYAGVQCEACHGPGSDYKKMNVMKDPKLSKEAGLIMPAPESCANCHNTTHHKDLKFDYKTFWPKIEHKLPAK